MGQLWDCLQDLIFPRACEMCGKQPDLPGRHLCWDCRADVRYVGPPFCARCGDPVAGRVDSAFVCWSCARNEPFFTLARSAARYDGPLKEVLRKFKYHNAVYLRWDLADLLLPCTNNMLQGAPIDGVTYVPLYPKRRRQRTYNQAELLAADLAGRFCKPLLRRTLRRSKPTPTQTHLTATERATNVRNAFEVVARKQVEGKRLLLVDDVMTTGATVNECARVLKEGGAECVYVVTVARG